MKQIRQTIRTCSMAAAFLGLSLTYAAGQQNDRTASQDKTARKEEHSATVRKSEIFKPGKDRWPVKTASDPDAGSIRLEPVKTTVEYLLSIPRPVDLPLNESHPWLQDHRAGPVETTLWTVEADVIECQLMRDGDYRVTIRGASGKTMVLEMPNPDPLFVDPKSPFAPKIKAARAQFDSRQQPEQTLKKIKGHAVITGIGFFGRAYGKKDPVEGNLIQLHPVLNIEWQDISAKESAVPTETEKKPADDADKEKALRTQLVGTWRMVSGKYGGQVFKFPDTDITYKHVTPTGFLWITYKKDTGRVYRAGGGIYTLKGDTYTEKVEYGIGDDFEVVKNGRNPFTARIEGDRWSHTGKLANGLTIEEVWERVKSSEQQKAP